MKRWWQVRSGAILEHPWECAFAFLFAIIGMFLIGSSFDVHITNFQTLPHVLVFAWAVMLLVSGPSMLYGLFSGNKVFARSVETAGLCLAGSAWSTYAVTLTVVAGTPWFGTALSATLAFACLLRIIAIRKVEKLLHDVAVATLAEEEM